MTQTQTSKKFKGPAPTQDYVLTSEKGHSYIDADGDRVKAEKGDVVPLTDRQYEAFKDRFVPAESAGAIESEEARVARLKKELADAEAKLQAIKDDADDDEGKEEIPKIPGTGVDQVELQRGAPVNPQKGETPQVNKAPPITDPKKPA